MLRWSKERRKIGVPLNGWLAANKAPTPADYAEAFPMEPVDFAALESPPGEAAAAPKPAYMIDGTDNVCVAGNETLLADSGRS